MNAFLQLVLNELRQGLFQALAVVILAVMVVGLVYRRHKKRYGSDRPFPWRKTVLLLVLVAYLAVLSYATLQRLAGYGASGVSFHLFRAWREAWNNFSLTSWLNILLNVAMFVPLGILLPVIWKNFRKWHWMLAAGLGLSLYVEVMQLVGSRGIFDIDDLFANTLGAMMGFCLLMVPLSLKEKCRFRALGYAALSMIPAAVVGGIFLAYQTQEYGNLPGAATYRVDTSGITWVLNCELTGESTTVPIYVLDLPTQAESDALRDTFARVLDVEFERTDYYDESTMYMDQSGTPGEAHFLTVRRLDGSWDYTGIYDNRTPAETDRETIEALLAAFGVSIPGGAQFSYLNSGTHQFTIDRRIDGNTMTDGTLTCVYNTEGMLSEIDNRLLVYSLSGEETIRSPREAYELLCGGYFASAGDRFEKCDPRPVNVSAWELSYQVDTKGFYLPVYLFTISAGNSEYSEIVMIPALAG